MGHGTFVRQKSVAGLVDDLVEADGGKIGELHFDDRPHPLDRRADGRADHRVFADGRIQHAPRKFLGQIFRGLERAAKRADILPVNEHARIVRQRLRLRFADGFEIGDAHGALKSAVALAFFIMSSRSRCSRGQRAPIFLVRIRRRFALHRGHGFLDLMDDLAAPDVRAVAASAHFSRNRYSSATFRQSRPSGEFFNFGST